MTSRSTLRERSTTCTTFSAVLGLVLFLPPAAGGCCLICDGVLICATSIEADCGSCGRPRAADQTSESEPAILGTIALSGGPINTYRLTEGESLTVGEPSGSQVLIFGLVRPGTAGEVVFSIIDATDSPRGVDALKLHNIVNMRIGQKVRIKLPGGSGLSLSVSGVS